MTEEERKYWEKIDPGMKSTDPVGDLATLLISGAVAKGAAAGKVGNLLIGGAKKASRWYNQGRLPNESTMPWKALRKRSWDQRQFTGSRPGQGVWNPFRGMPGYGTAKNIITGKPWNTPHRGGFGSGPDAAFRQAVERVGVPAAIGSLFIKNKKQK